MGKYLLGVNNGWVVKRFPEPEVWAEIAATKLDTNIIQFSFDLLDPMVDEDILNEIVSRTLDSCKQYGIKLQSCFTGGIAYSSNLLLHPSSKMRKYAFEWYSRAIDISRMLHVEDVGGYMGALTVKDFSDAHRRRSLLSGEEEYVTSLSRLCSKAGLETLLWEIMSISREPPSTIHEAQDLLQRLRSSPTPVKLCIDVGHTCNPHATDLRDRDPYAWLTELGADSPCVHVQQTDGKRDRHWPFTEEFNKVGIIDGERVLSSLDKSGADMTYIYPEVFPSFEQHDDQVIDDMVRTMRYWKEYL
ncbi:MAG: TIM barrel protein [Candidatus Bathyarchaeia archaeon]